MLYVFISSSCCMMKYDMNLAVKKVLELKTEIAKTLLIPVEDQVLLCSGGKELKSENIVGNYYGAGTDTNPIFFFSKYSNAVDLPYNVPARAPLDPIIEDDVQNCANMAPSSNTAAVRASLAQRFSEAAVKGRRECDDLVHGQHLQQQGWAAVIANLEDAKEALLKRKLQFEELYERYMVNRSSYQKIIQTFPSDIDLLSRIPLLPKLMLGSECNEEDLEDEHTLLSWFCSEPLSVLQSLTEKYQRSLDELDSHTLTALNEEICAVLKKTDNPDIKEVRGIEERLSSLNKQIEEAKQLEKYQKDLAMWFNDKMNQMSCDSAVLPDLCGTFQKQLLLMLDHHKCLRDILERCTRAKNELSENINYRIKYISRVESEMYDVQVHIIFLEKHVVSVMKQYESFRQVHTAPERYLELLAEVCRRRVFSSSFMKWSTEVSAQAFKLYHKEISIRKGFVGDDNKNMVDNLFPGMDDMPPPFAIECPRPFDQKLPNIVREDLEVMKIRFPELAHFCEVPPHDPMPYLSFQVGSDSAFSSNVPSSRIVGDSADFGGRSQKGLSSPHKLAAPAGDCNSLPSEYASLPNETFSLTSSPFEDPLLPPSNDVEFIPKRTKNSEQSADKSAPDVNFESDGDEFETVDPIEVRSHKSHDRKRSASAPRPNSTPEARSTSGDKCLKLSKARSDGDAISPIQERLKYSDSNDFQSTEYYIDDSMPSSYTESNATSPLLRGGQNRMVKSHHMVVAELQKQVDEKNGALVDAVRFIQELQGSLQGDLSSLRAYVKEEFWDKMSEISQIVENINRTMSHLQKQTLIEKEAARNEAKLLENTYLKRLEVECQKLNDAETQISNYEEYLQKLLTNFEELKHENEQLRSELSHKNEVIKSMLLEQELELDSLRDQIRHDAQFKDDEIYKITQTLNDRQGQVESLQREKEELEENMKRHMQEKEHMAVLLEEKEGDFSQKLGNLQEEIRRLHGPKEPVPDPKIVQELLSVKDELTQLKSTLPSLKIKMEESKARELSELEERLTAQHKDEMESLRSRYRMAISTTSTEKSTIVENTGGNEGLVGSKDLQKILDEYHKTCEAEKEECIRKLQEKQKEMLEKEDMKHDAEKAAIAANLQREHEENIERVRSRQMAEMQVSFNEAINSVTKEKDSVIEALRSKISDLEGNLLSIKVHLDKHSFSQFSSEAALSQSDTGASSSYKVPHMIDEGQWLEKLRKKIDPYLQILDLDASQIDDPKQSELKKIKLSCKSHTCTDCTFKISIFSCDVGDLILLCYEDKYENFLIFQFGQYVHFLHTDSLQPLGLKIPAGPQERWALGVVTNKDFCVTRKPSNRYKINLGTKFYRVKVKPWDREAVLADYQLYHSSQPSAKTDTQPSPSESDLVKTTSALAI